MLSQIEGLWDRIEKTDLNSNDFSILSTLHIYEKYRSQFELNVLLLSQSTFGKPIDAEQKNSFLQFFERESLVADSRHALHSDFGLV